MTRFISEQLLSNRVPGGVSEDDDLLGSGLIDSVGIMQLVLFIETEFAMDVPPEDVTIENFQTVTKIGAYLEGRRSEG